MIGTQGDPSDGGHAPSLLSWLLVGTSCVLRLDVSYFVDDSSQVILKEQLADNPSYVFRPSLAPSLTILRVNSSTFNVSSSSKTHLV